MQKYTFSSLLFCVGLLVILQTYQLPFAQQAEAEKALLTVQEQYRSNLETFQLATANYHKIAKEYNESRAAWSALSDQHFQTRLAFKRVEFLVDYFDRQVVKKSLNGAPLPSLEPAVPEVSVLHPQGLQILDEFIGGVENELDIEALLQQTASLKNSTKKVVIYQSQQRLEHRHVFEAARLATIRLFTLGLTGFDTPGTLHALPEARIVWQTLTENITPYKSLATDIAPELWPTVVAALDAGETLLANANDFDSFDRLSFLRAAINPLYSSLGKLQRGLGVETVNEITTTPQALTMGEASLFSETFFNVDYYSGEVRDEHYQQRLALGRLLFYDPILSSNNQRACASCHNPSKALTDGRAKSLAIDGEHTIQRNAPTVLNSAIADRYFYDLREDDLSRQIKHVIMDQHEFATDFVAVGKKLEQSQEYKQLFEQAYPIAGISRHSISNALSVYLGELTSYNSSFDQYARGETDILSESAKRGFNLFMGKAACGTCHFAPTFSGLVPPFYEENESEVLGVPVHPDSSYLDGDMGRYASGRPIDEAPFYAASFKTTTVRNIALTAPYMHNGAYHTLEQVMDFYNKGGGAGLGIELEYQTLAPDPLELTDGEIGDIITFMEHLTDTSRVGIPPTSLPTFTKVEWNDRPIGGTY